MSLDRIDEIPERVCEIQGYVPIDRIDSTQGSGLSLDSI